MSGEVPGRNSSRHGAAAPGGEVYDVMAEGFGSDNRAQRAEPDPLEPWEFVTQHHSDVVEPEPSDGSETAEAQVTAPKPPPAESDPEPAPAPDHPAAPSEDESGVFDIERWDGPAERDVREPVEVEPESPPSQVSVGPAPTEVGPPPIEVYVHPRVPDLGSTTNGERHADVDVDQDADEGRLIDTDAIGDGYSADHAVGAPPQSAPFEDDETQYAAAQPSTDLADENELPVDGERPVEQLFETEIDMTPVDPAEMTGIWLTTITGYDSPVWLDGDPADPDDLDVDPLIADRLRDWADIWNTQWDPNTGWLPRARITDYEGLGEWLARRVKDVSGAVTVTLQLAHFGRSGVHVIPGPEEREPIGVRVANDYGVRMPVWVDSGGEFVTEYGVGSFSSEINARLEAWAEQFEANMDPQLGWCASELMTLHANEGRALAAEVAEELGPDYQVRLDLWELGGRGSGRGSDDRDGSDFDRGVL